MKGGLKEFAGGFIKSLQGRGASRLTLTFCGPRQEELLLLPWPCGVDRERQAGEKVARPVTSCSKAVHFLFLLNTSHFSIK